MVASKRKTDSLMAAGWRSVVSGLFVSSSSSFERNTRAVAESRSATVGVVNRTL